ncbi:ankyrin repeat-containing domain protein, partial [Sordaria brevicollis]
MDPLSLIGGIIALVQAGNGLIKGFDKLRSLKEAPSDVAALANEVSELQSVFTMMMVPMSYLATQQAARVTPTLPLGKESAGQTRGQNEDYLQHLFDMTERAHETLQQLKQLQERVSGTTQANKKGKQSVSRIAWVFRDKKKAAELCRRLSQTRQNLSAAIVTLVVMHSSLIRDDEPEICLTVEPSVNDSETMLAVELEGPCPPYTADRDATEASVDLEEANWGTNYTLTSIAAFQTKFKCKMACPCRCHVKTEVQTPSWLKSVVGTLFVSYTGSQLWGKLPCDHKRCEASGKGSSAMTTYTWHFPTWMVSRALAFSLERKSLRGTNGSWTLHIPKMLTGADPIWRILDHGTVQQLAGILGQGQVSPCDMNPDGKSLLHFAVEFERPDMCKYLLEQGVNKNFEDHAGVSASAMAIEKVAPASAAASRVATLSEIRRMFEDDDLLETLNFPPLQLAIFRTLKNPALFAQHLDVNLSSLDAVDSFGRTALTWAAALDKPAVAELLLESGADTSVADKNKKTALHWAMKSQSMKVAELLLENGADVEALDIFGRTPLHEVAKVPNSEHLIELLITKGQADVEAPDYIYERTPLHLAAAHGRAENAAALIDHGQADLEAITKTQERTPLFTAITYGKEAMVRLLLDRGARIDVHDNTGQNVLHEAAKMGSAGVIEALRDYVVRLNETEEALDVQLEADIVDDSKRCPLNYFEWWRKDYNPHKEDEERAEEAFRELIREVRELSGKRWRSRVVLLDSDPEQKTRWLVDLERGVDKDKVDVSIVEISV